MYGGGLEWVICRRGSAHTWKIIVPGNFYKLLTNLLADWDWDVG